MNDRNAATITKTILATGICLALSAIGVCQEQLQPPSSGRYIKVSDEPGGVVHSIPDPGSFHSEIVDFDSVIKKAADRRETTQSLAWADALRIAQRMLVTNDKPTGVVSNFPVAKHNMVIAATADRIKDIKKVINDWARSEMSVEQIVKQWDAHRSTLVDVQATIFEMPQDKLDDFKRALAENKVKMESPGEGPVMMFSQSVDRESLKKIAKQVDVDLISAPRMITIIGQSARIMTGAEIPMITQKVGEVEFKHLGTKLEVTPAFPLDDPNNLRLFVELHDQLLLQKPTPDRTQPGFWSRGLQASLDAAADQTTMLVYKSKSVANPNLPAHEADDVVKAIFFTANRVTHTVMPRR